MRNRLFLFFVNLLRLCPHSLLPVAAHCEIVTRTVEVMGTELTVTVQHETGTEARKITEVAVRAVEEVEARLSTWRADTELARLNSAPLGEPISLSRALCFELGRALEWARRTGGTFDPTLGALVEAYQLRGSGHWPTHQELKGALAKVGWSFLHLSGCKVTKTGPVILEEGAFGKGAALDAALRAVAGRAQSVLLNLGGQLAFAGSQEDVGLTHPQERQRVVAWWRVKPGSVATSANTTRKRLVAGRLLPHLLDPRTGLPAEDFGSVTVWAPSALDADCLSTALFVMGPEDGMAWLASYPQIAAVYLLTTPGGLGLLATPNCGGQIRIVDANTHPIHPSPAKGKQKGEAQ